MYWVRCSCLGLFDLGCQLADRNDRHTVAENHELRKIIKTENKTLRDKTLADISQQASDILGESEPEPEPEPVPEPEPEAEQTSIPSKPLFACCASPRQ